MPIISPDDRKQRKHQSARRLKSVGESLPSEPRAIEARKGKSRIAQQVAKSAQAAAWPAINWNKPICRHDPRRKLIIKALCKHHKYADGIALNQKPVCYAHIIDATKHKDTGAPVLSPAVISEIFQDQFEAGYRGYKYLCWTGRIGPELQRLILEEHCSQ